MRYCTRKSRGAGARGDYAIAIRVNEGIAAAWLANEGGDEGAAMGGLVSRLKFAMLDNA